MIHLSFSMLMQFSCFLESEDNDDDEMMMKKTKSDPNQKSII